MNISWDDEIPNIWKNNPNVPNRQAVSVHHHLKSACNRTWKIDEHRMNIELNEGILRCYI